VRCWPPTGDGETTQRRGDRGRLTSGGRHQPALTSVAFVRANAMLLSLCYVAAEAVRQSEELSGLPGLPMAVWLGTASICWCRITHQPSARTTRRPSPVAGQAGLKSVQLPLPSSLALPASKQHDRNHPTKDLKAARLFFLPLCCYPGTVSGHDGEPTLPCRITSSTARARARSAGHGRNGDL
jgi:hypothetical protein